MSLLYDSLHDALLNLADEQSRYADDVTRFVQSCEERFKTEERLIAEIRDELHEALTALSNRIEAVTRAG